MTEPALRRGRGWQVAQWAVGVGGVLFSLALALQVPEGVFYSGDGGLKALMVRQLSQGHVSAQLLLPHEAGEARLWNGGLYPFGPPFVYASPAGHTLAFPLAFPLLSVPGYLLLGYAGLYLVPLLSLWILWLSFAAVAGRLLSPGAALGALVALILDSPLTLYGGMFWEHTLGVLVAFSAVALLVSDPLRTGSAVLLGLFSGASLLIRPEAFLLVLACGLVALLDRRRRQAALAFLCGCGALAVVWLSSNVLLYEQPLGAHGLQLLAGTRPGYGELFAGLVKEVALTLPVTGFVLLAAPLALAAPQDHRAARMMGAGLLVLLSVPLLLPNVGGRQWGPRYLLPLVPLVCLIAGLLLDRVRGSRHRTLRGVLSAVFCVTVAIGAYRNVAVGPSQIREGYARRKAALDHVLASDVRTIAVNSQHVAQELAWAQGRKQFFLIGNRGDLRRLCDDQLRRSRGAFLMLVSQEGGGDLAERVEFPPPLVSASAVRFARRGKFGLYTAYDATCVGRSQIAEP